MKQTNCIPNQPLNIPRGAIIHSLFGFGSESIKCKLPWTVATLQLQITCGKTLEYQNVGL